MDQFVHLKYQAVACAEAGDFSGAAGLFRSALCAAGWIGTATDTPQRTAAAGTAADGVVEGGGGALPSGSPPPPGRAAGGSAAVMAERPPNRAAVSAVHDMLAQCLMELAGSAGEGQPHPHQQQDGTGAAEAGVGLCRGKGEAHALRHLSGGCLGGGGDGQAVAGEGSGEAEAMALWQQALVHAAEAVELRPQWPPSLLTYGRCCRNCGHLDEAMRALNSAVQLLRGTSNCSSPHACASAIPHPHGRPSSGLNCGMDASAGPCCGDLGPGQGDDPNCPPADGLGAGAELALEVEAELQEVCGLWQERLARDVGLPGLRGVHQDSGQLGGGPSRRVWECGVLLAAYLVHAKSSRAATPVAAELTGAGGSGSEAREVEAYNAPIAGSRVLELGCGSGLVGLAAAACGATCVLTDLPATLHAATDSAAANRELVRAGGGRAVVRPLDWADGSGVDAAAAAAWLLHGRGPWAQAVEGEWGPCREEVAEVAHVEGVVCEGNGLHSKGADVAACGPPQPAGCRSSPCWVVGADVVYSAAQVAPLVALLSALRAAAKAADACAASARRVEAAVAEGPGSPALLVPLTALTASHALRPCHFLLAHKHRSEAVSQQLFGALRAAGVQLRQVEPTHARCSSGPCRGGVGCGTCEGECRLRALVSAMPASVMLYEGRLW